MSVDTEDSECRCNAEQLIDLRAKVETHIEDLRRALEKQLASLGVSGKKRGRPARNGRAHPLKGKKVKAKYRSAKGQAWTGRGLLNLLRMSGHL